MARPDTAAGAATRPGGQATTRPDPPKTRPHARGHARPVRTWGCCWAVGCALGALSLFLTRFDSVLFLSQFLDIVHDSVHEHYSSQKNFEFFLVN